MTKLPSEADSRIALATYYKKSFYAFCRAAWRHLDDGQDMVEAKYISVLCSHAEWVWNTGNNLIVNIPPRHAKSTIFSVLFHAWVWAQNPRVHFLSTTYGDKLTRRDAVAARKLIKSDWYRSHFGTYHFEKDTETRYTLFEGGSRMATSIGGTVTGEGAHIRIIDDPIDASESFNRNTIDSANEYYGTFTTRTRGKFHPVILIMQRLAKGDMTDFLLKKGNFYHLVLPMRFNENADEKSTTPPEAWPPGMSGDWREDGELLNPEMYDQAQHDEWENDLGVKATGQLKQAPVVQEGALFRTDQISEYTVLPYIKEKKIFADTAEEEGQHNDFSVLMCVGLGEDDNLYIIDLWRGRWTATVLLSKTREFLTKHKPGTYQICQLSEIVIELASSGRGLYHHIRDDPGTVARGIDRHRDKISRANNVMPTYDTGIVKVPANPTDFTTAAWVEEFTSELAEFSADMSHRHDDQVDPLIDAIENMVMPRRKRGRSILFSGRR